MLVDIGVDIGAALPWTLQGTMMDTAKAEENRTAYDDFLARLNRQMREMLGMDPPLEPSDGDRPQAFREAEKPSE
jgi:hypothetical protein